MDYIQDILDSDLSEFEKIIQAFDRVVMSFVDFSQKEMDLHQALGDHESRIKMQVKAETYKHARTILDECIQIVRHYERK